MLDQSVHILNQNAIDILMADHRKVKKLFSDYAILVADGRSYETKGALAKLICKELTNHTIIEEEIFYPRVRSLIYDNNLMDEAKVEHGTFKELVDQIESMDPEDDLYDAKVIVLGEYVEHHVKEEENEMFPRVKTTSLDLEELGENMTERKEELESRSGASLLDKIKDSIGVA